MTKRRSSSASTPSQSSRLTIGGIAAVVILVIVFIAQIVGLDVLNTEDGAEPTAVPTTIAGGPTDIRRIPGGFDGGWFQLYFTDPATPSNSPLENALVTAINTAQTSIDAAVFEFNSQPVTDALIDAHERGLRVRIVTDGEFGIEQPDTTVDQLDAADIPIVSDERRGALMHDKFFIFDGVYVWTGSTNITESGIYENNNNAIMIRSRQLADNYTAEFEELFAGEFGTTSPNNIPNPIITVNDTRIETFFESEGKSSFEDYASDFPARLAELLNEAETVYFMANVLSRDDLMNPILERVEAGEMTATGIIESVQRRFSKPLFCANLDGLDVREDTNPSIFHHKVFIIDQSIVVTGSFNFSASAADNNDENILIIHSPGIAEAYMEEFNARWAESETPSRAELEC
jgi:phosphatidylserine/phosphatidylglycerophosphate/cardiolipin synthase-like enzyme